MPFIGEVFGGPSVGKTTLIRILAGRLGVELGYAVRMFGNSDLGAQQIKRFAEYHEKNLRLHPHRLTQEKRDIQRRAINLMKSYAHRAIMLEVGLYTREENPATIVLLEHGRCFTWAVECYGNGISGSDLLRGISLVDDPDLVLYLPGSFEELRDREKSPMFSDEAYVRRVLAGMEEMDRQESDREKWVRVPVKGPPDKIADYCLPILLSRYEAYWNKVKSPSLVAPRTASFTDFKSSDGEAKC